MCVDIYIYNKIMYVYIYIFAYKVPQGQKFVSCSVGIFG